MNLYCVITSENNVCCLVIATAGRLIVGMRACVCVCVYVCVCVRAHARVVCPPPRLLITSGVMWCGIDTIAIIG